MAFFILLYKIAICCNNIHKAPSHPVGHIKGMLLTNLRYLGNIPIF